MSDTTEQEIIVLEPSNNDHNLSDEIVQHEPAAQKFNYKNLIPKIDTIVKTDDSIDGELVKNISSEYSPEQQLLQKMDEMKMEPDEVIAVPKLVDLFNAINKYDYATGNAFWDISSSLYPLAVSSSSRTCIRRGVEDAICRVTKDFCFICPDVDPG